MIGLSPHMLAKRILDHTRCSLGDAVFSSQGITWLKKKREKKRNVKRRQMRCNSFCPAIAVVNAAYPAPQLETRAPPPRVN